MAIEIPAEEVTRLNERFDSLAPPEILGWAAEFFGSSLMMTSSFGAESMCTLHMAQQAMPGIRIAVINTGYLFPETLAFMEAMRSRFGLNILEYHTRQDPVTWLTIHGEADPSRRQNVEACCAANKNEVFDRAMKELSPGAWIRGVRADQSQTRANLRVLEWSRRNGCWAISPILHWHARDIHKYMKANHLPYHPLWEKGYVSIGCNPITCTRPVGEGQDERSGRWSGMEKKECGIHLEG